MRQLRILLAVGTLGELTDGQLLERFATQPAEMAEAAFAALVERHGPMVLRVCQGILVVEQDVHDAFQATFLVLVRKARGLWVRDSLGPWLYQVAYRTASYARSEAAARRRHERRAAELRVPTLIDEKSGESIDWAPVLHEEIARLPERYRIPLMLCSLEGVPQEEVARSLRLPLGTVKSRLARGRERLKSQLNRRGLTGALLPIEPIRSAIPATLADRIVRVACIYSSSRAIIGSSPTSAVILAEGVMKSMAMVKFGTAIAASLACSILATGLVVGAQNAPVTGQSPDIVAVPTAAEYRGRADVAGTPESLEQETARHQERIQGVWKIRKLYSGRGELVKDANYETLTFEGDKKYITASGRPYEATTFRLDATKLPRTIDFEGRGLKFEGIYEFDGQHLRIAYLPGTGSRPTHFDRTKCVLYELDRESKGP